MFMCGEQAVFFSHLPVFGHPHHDFQALIEVKLMADLSATDPRAKGRKEPLVEYLGDRQKTGQTLYTFQPKPFRLPDLVLPPSHALVRTVAGSIVHGHFAKGGTAIANALANTETIFHFRQFDPEAKALGQLEYILFGKDRELFLAHLIMRPPDFDQVVSVTASGSV
jgi:hypothetical protein